MNLRAEVSRICHPAPPDVRWPGLFCPVCDGRLTHWTAGWCCLSCEAVWLFDGTAGTWVEPRRQEAA
jgi:hypothetical protein